MKADSETMNITCQGTVSCINCKKSSCNNNCQEMDFEGSTETERATRHLESLNKDFFVDDFGLKQHDYLSDADVQNCIEIESTNVITIQNDDFIEGVSTQINITDECGNPNQDVTFIDLNQETYDSLSYPIYEETIPNSTENFPITQISDDNFEDNESNFNLDSIKADNDALLKPSENINDKIVQTFDINSLNDVQNFDLITLNPESIIVQEPVTTVNLEYQNSDSNSLEETSKSTAKLSEVPNKFTCDNLHNTSTLLSPKSESDQEQNETDLTSLNWLHNFTNFMSVPNLPTPPVSPKPKGKTRNCASCLLDQIKKESEPPKTTDLSIDISFYKKNGDKKPPFSYATLICMAMGKNGNRMTLSAIYHWIRENFLYYRKAHPSWQNSIRHNLSLNKCFIKQARSKNEPGKGGFWKLDLQRLEESRKAKRRSSLTVRTPKNGQLGKATKPQKKTKRYRPNSTPGERKHNILSNISICGATDIENVEEAARANHKNKKANSSSKYQSKNKILEDSFDFSDTSLDLQDSADDVKLKSMDDSAEDSLMDTMESLSQNVQRALIALPPSMPQQPAITEPVAPPIVGEEELTGLLLSTNGWDDCQLEMLDSLLDSL